MKVVRYSRLSLGKALSRNIPGHAPVAPATLPGLVAQHHGAEHRRLLLRQTVANLACFRQLQQGRRRHCLRRSLRIGKSYGCALQDQTQSQFERCRSHLQAHRRGQANSFYFLGKINAEGDPKPVKDDNGTNAFEINYRLLVPFETSSTPISLRRDRFTSTYTCYPLLRRHKHNEDH